MNSPPRDGTSARPFDMAFGSLVGLGVLVRVWAFMLRGALWNDEAGLALNVVGRAWSQVGRPFVYQQYAPYLYVLTSKSLAESFGPSAHTLRMLSLLSGIALLPVMLLFVSSVSGWPAALFGLALLVPNTLLVLYATEFKPYATDALVAAGLCLLSARVLAANSGERRRWLVALGGAGLLAPWFSLPSIFVLAGAGAALCVEAWEREQRRLLLGAAGLGTLWLISFALHYLGFMQMSPADALYMQNYWSGMNAFAPFPPRSFADLRWYVAKFFWLFDLFVAPGAFGLRYLAGALWLWGAIGLWRTQRGLFVLLMTPLVLLLAASSMHKYLVSDRLMLFLVPSLITPVVSALAELAQLRGPRTQLAAAAAAVLFCAAPTLGLSRTLAAGPAPHGVDEVVEHLQQRWQPGDRLYVETQAQWIFSFYARLAHFDAPFPISDDGLYDPTPRYTTLDGMIGAPRVWVVVPTAGSSRPQSDEAASWVAKAEKLVTKHLEEHGRVLDMLDGGNTRLYLYDLSSRSQPHLP